MFRNHFTARQSLLVIFLFATAATLLFVAEGASAQGPGRNPRAPSSFPVGTGFTYQGQLKSGGALVNGTCTLAFRLYDDAGGGNQIGSPITQTIAITNGLFTTQLNTSNEFGATPFNGYARWLEIRVSNTCPSAGSFTTLAPRQALTPAPMALALPGLYIKQDIESPNLIGGYSGNVISNTVFGGTIGGGGFSGSENRMWANYATIGGGSTNTANGLAVTIGGGSTNTAGGFAATIGGGFNNTASGNYAAIPGGVSNVAVTYTFAAGRKAQANHQGSFVWADCDPCAGSGTTFATTGDNQFLVRANGGMGVNTNNPAADTLTVGGSGLRVATDGTTFARIQSGAATLGSGAPSTTNVYTVTFPSTFSATPKVLATVRNDYPSWDVTDTYAVTVRRVSTSNFVVNVYRVDVSGGAWSQSLKLDWMAWE